MHVCRSLLGYFDKFEVIIQKKNNKIMDLIRSTNIFKSNVESNKVLKICV